MKKKLDTHTISPHWKWIKAVVIKVIPPLWLIKGLYSFCLGFAPVSVFIYDFFPLAPKLIFVPITCPNGLKQGVCVCVWLWQGGLGGCFGWMNEWVNEWIQDEAAALNRKEVENNISCMRLSVANVLCWPLFVAAGRRHRGKQTVFVLIPHH